MGNLPDQLATILRENTDENYFNSVLEKERIKLKAERRAKIRKDDLESLFNTQIRTLKDRGVPEQILAELSKKREVVIRHCPTTDEGNIPFLPVISPGPSTMSYQQLMTLVRNGNHTGRAYSTEFRNLVKTPFRNIYWIYNIDRPTTHNKAQKRSALVVAETISLCILTDILSVTEGVWASGSEGQYTSEPAIDETRPLPGAPAVYIGTSGSPCLCWSNTGRFPVGWWTPHCESRDPD